MRTDGLFTTKHVTIPTRVGESIWLRPFGDVHRDNDLHADREWQDWLKTLTDKSRRCLWLGMGDYCDFMRAHTRAFVAAVEIEAQDVQDSLQRGCKEWVTRLADELRPARKNIIGLLGGNHWMELVFRSKGETNRIHSDKHLADLLDAEYLGTMCAVTLTLDDGKAGKRAEVRIIAHHGSGGATTIGGSLNRVQRMLHGWHVDIALMGDDHKRGAVPVGDRLTATVVDGRSAMVCDTRWVGRTGSFLRGFEPGKSSYVVDRAFEPTSIGTIEFELKLKTNPATGQTYVAIGGYQPA